MIGTPKARFMENKSLVKTTLALVASEDFQKTLDAVMLQLIQELPDNNVPQDAYAGYYRIMGANRFRKKLETIASTPKPGAKEEDSGLNYGAQ